MRRIFLQICMLIVPGLLLADDDLRLSDEVIPLRVYDFPQRPAPLIELGNPLLATGPISKGFTLPTGAVWQPSLVVWGDIRNAIQTVDADVDGSGQRLTEFASRVDLFGNLAFTATERILIGFRPLDRNGRFTRYSFEEPEGSPFEEGAFTSEANLDLTLLFFEGDFGQIFPFLDPGDRYGLDYAFAVGRQPVIWQNGMLVNDRLDAFGVSKINLKHSWAVNHRMTFLYAWDELNRNVLAEVDSGSSFFGWSNEIDFRPTTVEFDVIYISGSEFTGDGLYAGLGFTQRVYDYNSTFRILTSNAIGDVTDHNESGVLLFGELSTDISGTTDYVYLNGFYGINRFRSASRAPEFGGPLGATGVLFAALGLGRYGAPLDNQPDDAFGGALGVQMFFNNRRQTLLLEAGGRYAMEEVGQRASAVGLSYQMAIGTRHVLRFDSFLRYGMERTMPRYQEDSVFSVGGRMEWMIRL
jgi:hypothetical protein